MSPQRIADALNERDVTAAKGGKWPALRVCRVLDRIEAHIF